MKNEWLNFDTVGIQRKWAQDNVGGTALRWGPYLSESLIAECRGMTRDIWHRGAVFLVAESDQMFQGDRQEDHRETKGSSPVFWLFPTHQPVELSSSCRDEWVRGRKRASYITIWKFSTWNREAGEKELPSHNQAQEKVWKGVKLLRVVTSRDWLVGWGWGEVVLPFKWAHVTPIKRKDVRWKRFRDDHLRCWMSILNHGT